MSTNKRKRLQKLPPNSTRSRSHSHYLTPSSTSSYRYTHALLLSWAEDDIGISSQILILQQVLATVYSFTTVNISEIPSQDSFNFVKSLLWGFIARYGGANEDLLVVYYSGHGELDEEGMLVWLAANPNLPWTRLQKSLESTPSDVLLILDSCASAGSINFSPTLPTHLYSKPSNTEILAACGFETDTPGLGPNTFFNILVEELCAPAAIMREFSVLELHKRILGRCVRRGGSRTPVYIRVGGSRGSIPLRVGGDKGEGLRMAKLVLAELRECDREMEDEEARVGDVSYGGDEDSLDEMGFSKLRRVQAVKAYAEEGPAGC